MQWSPGAPSGRTRALLAAAEGTPLLPRQEELGEGFQRGTEASMT
jgi:hypothetical protein